MSELMLTIYEDNKFRMNTLRLSPLITWLQFFNFITIAVVCLFFLKIYKSLMLLREWLFSFEIICEKPVILVMGPNNKIVQEMVHQLSQKFDSEIIKCQDVNDNHAVAREDVKKIKKSKLIFNHKSINNQNEILDFAKFVRKSYGLVDVLIVVRDDDPVENSSPNVFLNQLNKQLLSQFWTVMAFLPAMMHRNSGRIVSVALGKSPVTNTGIMRTVYEDLLQSNTKVKLTLLERNTLFSYYYYSFLPTDILVKLILRSMWNSNAIVKVPSFSCLLLVPVLFLSKFVLKPTSKLINFTLSRIL